MMNPETTQVGDVLPEVRFGPISRGKLALYAGASGDHNPVHIDIDFAKKAGLEDVFAHGMLSFGVLSRVVTEWAGPERLLDFGARFVSITNVHDFISCTGRVAEFSGEGPDRRARIELIATAQDGRQTLIGEAQVSLA